MESKTKFAQKYDPLNRVTVAELLLLLLPLLHHRHRHRESVVTIVYDMKTS